MRPIKCDTLYGCLVDDAVGFEIEIVRWPAPGWRPVDEGTGDEGGVDQAAIAFEILLRRLQQGDMVERQRRLLVGFENIGGGGVHGGGSGIWVQCYTAIAVSVEIDRARNQIEFHP